MRNKILAVFIIIFAPTFALWGALFEKTEVKKLSEARGLLLLFCILVDALKALIIGLYFLT